MEGKKLDQLCVNTIRFLSIDAVQRANSGHPGLPLDAAPMAYVLWTRFLKHNPSNPQWVDRDRFVLSAGHGSMLLYAMLHLTGYDLTIDDIKNFRQWESKTPGHPELHLTPGVETTTGPLGQGFANGVGMAIAEAHLAARFNRPDFPVVSHFTYSLVSDGDMMEGVASEAASLAGHLRLGKLIYLYDNNHISLSAGTDMTFTEDRAKRFDAYGWHVQHVTDGNDLQTIEAAIKSAKDHLAKPSLIIVDTHLGYGSPNKQDTFEAHGSPLGQEEVALTKKNLGWPSEQEFWVPDEAKGHFLRAVDRGHKAEERWVEMFDSYRRKHPKLAEEFERLMDGGIEESWDSAVGSFPADEKGMKTRVALGKIMNATAAELPGLMGGSADLDPSTHTALAELGDFQPGEPAQGDKQGEAGGGWNYAGRNVHFGVREHGMGAILNGMAVHGGTIPFGSTFLIFSDYMRPPIRLAAIMKQRVIYVFTHDSIGLGEDGTTHQPIEQLAGLRAIPDITVIRPADANETIYAWRIAVETRDHPVVLILTRQNVPTLDRTKVASADGVMSGAYVLSDAGDTSPDLILIATGSEVSLALKAQEKLNAQNIKARVVSMPSWEVFQRQSEEYRNSVLPPEIKARVSIEAGSTFGWRRYAGEQGDTVGIDHFGASAPGDVLMDKYGLTVEAIVQRAKAVMKNQEMIRT